MNSLQNESQIVFLIKRMRLKYASKQYIYFKLFRYLNIVRIVKKLGNFNLAVWECHKLNTQHIKGKGILHYLLTVIFLMCLFQSMRVLKCILDFLGGSL